MPLKAPIPILFLCRPPETSGSSDFLRVNQQCMLNRLSIRVHSTILLLVTTQSLRVRLPILAAGGTGGREKGESRRWRGEVEADMMDILEMSVVVMEMEGKELRLVEEEERGSMLEDWPK